MPTRDDETPLDPVEALLAECLQRPASERQAAVARACHEHPELARELQARLTLLEEFGGPLDAPDPREVPRQLGDFRLLSRLGGGGMGVVYRARQESLDREVALKLLRPDQLYFPSAHERFHREAQAVARLQHSGIVPIYTVGEHEGVPYFAMELVRGCTLAEVLAGVDGRDPARLTGRDVYAVVAGRLGLDAEAPADPPMGPPFGASWVDACLHVLRQVAVALGHAHERGVLHRDLKPSNVLLQPDGRALLCDFGLSSDASLDRMTREGSHLGTLPYMSPEQASGSSAVDATSDVYGLGVTMYELLTLELPYAGESTARTLALIERGEPAPIRARNRTVGADVETVCLAAMERDRARRYPDARAFAADLSALLERRPIRARPPGPWLRLRRAVQRRPAAAAAIVLAAALAVGLPAQGWWQARRRLEVEAAARREALRELDLTQAANHFVLSLFRRGGTQGPPGRPPTAVDVLEAGPELAREEFAGQPTVLARVELMLGRVLYELRRPQAAAPLVSSAVERLEAGESTVDRRGLPNALLTGAQIDIDLGNLERGEQRLDRLSAVLERNPPADETIFDSASATRAHLLVLQGEIDRAEQLLSTTLERIEARGGEAAGQVGATLGVLGTALLKAGEDRRALPILERAERELERASDTAPAQLCSLLSNLGLLHTRLGDAAEAADDYERALALSGSIWADANVSHAMLLSNLGSLHERIGKTERALDDYRRAMAEYETLGLAATPDAVKCGIATGEQLFLLERWEDAAAVLERWHPRQIEQLGTASADVAETYLRRAKCAAELGDRDGALELVDRGLAGLGPDSDGAETVTVRNELVGLGDEISAGSAARR